MKVLETIEKSARALLPDLIELRRELHRYPERSREETMTAVRLKLFLEKRGLLPLSERIAGNGLLYRIGPKNGKKTFFRADMDAVPILEESGRPYASLNPGLHHACGHDGHMAMLAGALLILSRLEAIDETIFFFFQPAEEIGEGMRAALEHPSLRDLKVDTAYAIHNVPGHSLGTVLLPLDAAATASTGMRIALQGASSHASEPYRGRNPIPVLADLIQALQGAPASCLPYGHPALVTLTCLEAGDEAYGSTPRNGFLGLTLRADAQEDLDALVEQVRNQVEERARIAGLTGKLELVEPFPATRNHGGSLSAVEKAAGAASLPLKKSLRPFPWSEDFGYATRRWPGALIGLGAGEEQSALHSSRYDFPDELLVAGIRLLTALTLPCA